MLPTFGFNVVCICASCFNLSSFLVSVCITPPPMLPVYLPRPHPLRLVCFTWCTVRSLCDCDVLKLLVRHLKKLISSLLLAGMKATSNLDAGQQPRVRLNSQIILQPDHHHVSIIIRCTQIKKNQVSRSHVELLAVLLLPSLFKCSLSVDETWSHFKRLSIYWCEQVRTRSGIQLAWLHHREAAARDKSPNVLHRPGSDR